MHQTARHSGAGFRGHAGSPGAINSEAQAATIITTELTQGASLAGVEQHSRTLHSKHIKKRNNGRASTQRKNTHPKPEQSRQRRGKQGESRPKRTRTLQNRGTRTTRGRYGQPKPEKRRMRTRGHKNQRQTREQKNHAPLAHKGRNRHLKGNQT